MAKNKRSSAQPSRQQRRLMRRPVDVDRAAAEFSATGAFTFRVPAGFEAEAARLWAEVTEGQGVLLANGEEVAPS